MTIPARCLQCGHVFSTPFVGLGAGATVNATDNMTFCPECGELARFGDGVFQGTQGGGVKLVSGPPETHAMMEQLYGIAQKAKDEKLTAKEILAEVAEINPALAKKLEKRPLPAFILILFLIFFAKNLDVKIDVNHLIDQAWHISQREDPEKHFEEYLAKVPVAETSAAGPRAKKRELQRHLRRERLARRPAERPKR